MYAGTFVNGPVRTGLTELSEVGCMCGFSLIVFRGMMCEAPFQHPYLSFAL